MSGTHALGLSCADSSALLAEYLARPADLRPCTTAFISSPWLNIPATHGLIFLRFGVHAQFRGSNVSRCYGPLDIVDLMWQPGWPSLCGTHLGGGWLGIPPTGQKVEMRVADWYQVVEVDLIIDNWVMIVILQILDQRGLDALDDLHNTADRSLPRWPS